MVAAVDGSSMAAYYTEISRVAILSREQQLQHCKRIRQWLDWPGGRDQAPPGVQRSGKRSLNRMVESNLRMVVVIAKRYANHGVPLADLIQEGNIGLLTACEKFDPERGYCFSTFSYWWIRQGITRCLSNTSRIIRVPCNISDLARRIRQLQSRWQVQHGQTLSQTELASALNLPLERVQLALLSSAIQPKSLDEVVLEDGNSLGEVISQGNEPPRYGALEEEWLQEELKQAISQLAPAQQELVLELTLQQRSVHQLAMERKVPKARILQQKEQALDQLRQILAPTGAGPTTTITKKPKPQVPVNMAFPKPEPIASAVQLCFENVILPA